MKKSLITLFITINFLLLPISTAFAHVLQTDGSIGAVLHIDPEDDPIVGQTAGFFFEFKDKQNKFKPENCDCTFSIIEANKEIYSQPLFQNNTDPSLGSASLFFIFPQKDVYQIKVMGKPLSTQAFQPFTLKYAIRVARDKPTTAQNSPHHGISPWLFYIPVFFILFFGIFFYMRKRSKLHLLMLAILFVFLHALPIHLVLHHQQLLQGQAFTHPCCMPQNALHVPNFKITPPVYSFVVQSQKPAHLFIGLSITPVNIRSPPDFIS